MNRTPNDQILDGLPHCSINGEDDDRYRTENQRVLGHGLPTSAALAGFPHLDIQTRKTLHRNAPHSGRAFSNRREIIVESVDFDSL
jgi:hypothetical protein